MYKIHNLGIKGIFYANEYICVMIVYNFSGFDGEFQQRLDSWISIKGKHKKRAKSLACFLVI